MITNYSTASHVQVQRDKSTGVWTMYNFDIGQVIHYIKSIQILQCEQTTQTKSLKYVSVNIQTDMEWLYLQNDLFITAAK